jgi:hypothetical protein
MTPEERLRRAIAARAHSVEPSDDGLDRITEKLLTSGGDMKLPPTSDNARWYLVAAAAVVLAGIAGAITLVSKDGDGDGTDDFSNQPRTTVTLDPTTSPSSTSTTVPVITLPTGIYQTVWPRMSSSVHFDDPIAAVNSFARFYMGLQDPVLGEFQQGDTRSGEVEVRAAADRPITTAAVQQLDDDNWYVVASSTENIDVTSPVIEDTLSCPVRLQGTALAFEGTVQIRIDAYLPDGKSVEVARGHVTGSGSPPAGPFDEQIPCRIPEGVEPYAILTAYTTDESEQVEGMIEAATQTILLP